MRGRRTWDGGHTIVELVTVMVVVSVLAVAFATAVRLMTVATSRTRSFGDSVTQSRAATDAFSRSVPYAAAVNQPTRVGTDWYLETLTSAVPAGTDPTCTQWRVRTASDDLQMRTWSTVTRVATGWVTVARDVTNDPTTRPPFTAYVPDAAYTLPRVAVDLGFTGPSGGDASAQSVYALRNGVGANAIGTDVVCTEVGRP